MASVPQLRHGGRLLAFSPMAGEAMGGPSMGGPSKAARYEKVEGRMGYRVLFDGPAQILDGFRQKAEFVFS